MENSSCRFLAVAALLLGVAASGVAGAQALPCADYITTGAGDAPDGGELVGTETRRETYGGKIGVDVGVTGSYESGLEREYEVGYYRMSSGRMIAIDCRTYTAAGR